MNLEVKVLDPNRRGLKLAVVVLPEDEAIKLEELSRLKVGMTSCRRRTGLRCVTNAVKPVTLQKVAWERRNASCA